MTTEKSCCGPDCCQPNDTITLTARAPRAEEVRATVREKYGAAAERAAQGKAATCGC